ncbi:MAG: HlyD family efflux transporter periplasmic adaptor subunit [bacterium]|nr:HlyD family efflux transporter periplasmic adaptor subunit [bacterium]
MTTIKTISALTLLLFSCSGSKNKFDASGTFESVETIVSSEAVGVIKQLNLYEGDVLKKGQLVGYVDSVQLYLRKKQLQAQIKAVLSRSPNIPTQVAALQEQLKQAEKDQERFTNLVKADAATQKQLDDVSTQIAVLNKQIMALQSSLGISAESLNEETVPLSVQIEQINDQLSKCRLVNPLNGSVLVKYVEENEMTAIGKPLYKIADLSSIILRAYITGDQLPTIKLEQKVKVLVDDGAKNYIEHEGLIEWISDKAEFTPKTIQTKDERANLVYAIKIKLKNDGSMKIGMYADVKF